jgi:hypothetical protein
MPHFREEPHFFDEVLSLYSIFGVYAGKNALEQSEPAIRNRFHAHRGLKTGVHRFLAFAEG